MMNLKTLLLTLSLLSCDIRDKVSPNVQTYILHPNSIVGAEQWEIMASKVLYEFYMQSDKEKEFYEVVENDYFHVLNYWPKQKILTLTTKIADGWSSQYQDVNEEKLKELSDSNTVFMKYDAILTRANPRNFEIIKSNHNTRLTK